MPTPSGPLRGNPLPAFAWLSAAALRLLRSWRLGLLAVVASGCFLVIGQTVPPVIPAVNLSADPLYAAAATDKPTMTLALSVEYPTVGAQYLSPPASSSLDASYSNATEYLGYYDAESCYTYNDRPSETVASGMTASDYKRFDLVGKATSRMCTDAFSGNFLNWASSSAIDMLRLSLSGGDRYIDTPTLTILQRAVLPDGDPVCMWNSTNFQAKQLQRNGGGAGKYWGAVPSKMVNAAGTNDIWIANTLNRIYFGTSQTGGCGSTSGYTLSAAIPQAAIGPVTNPYATPSTGLSSFTGGTLCASENGACSFTGVREVLYGAPRNGSLAGGWMTVPISSSGSFTCSNTMTGSTVDPAPGIVKNCYIRSYSGTWVPPNSANALNSDGFFYARVNVCNVDSGGVLQDTRDYGLCTVYPSGSYKPVGVIQKYSDQLRIAAFGYLMDQTASYNNGRYGGVLRAPMKYVGLKTFDESGLDNTPGTGNPNAEWDARTGVFSTNPDNDTTFSPGISGVINYLNKFGRTGSVPGRYKKFDPIGELHYETLRYLQGLQPSPDAISGLGNSRDLYDGFPVTTTWADPFGGSRTPTSANYACLKNNVVVIGDINTHDGNRLPAVNVAANIPDISYWTGIAGAFERNSTGTQYRDGQNVLRNVSNPNTANTSPPGQQIVGSAYWAHSHDIRGTDWTAQPTKQRPGMRVKTFAFDVNEYAAQTDANTRRYRNQLFTAAKYGGYEADPANPGKRSFNTFGNPFQKQDGTYDNDVWQDPANPGEASAYYLQSSARGVLRAFDDIFNRTTTQARSIAGAAVSAKRVVASGSALSYQAQFDTTDWSGDVQAFSINNQSAVSIGGSAQWSAAARLNALSSPATSRNIVVGLTGTNPTFTARNFLWNSINSTLQDALNKSAPTSSSDGLGQDRLNYLRGDKSKEATSFRPRSKLLGDIVNSGVVYSAKTSTPAVFVGANDGMLHAFDAATGEELFGYIPSWIAPQLPALTSKTYNSNHRSFVDATPVVTQAIVGATEATGTAKTVLVSGTGGGGRGVFALDVTDPSSFSASKVLWEFTQADDTDMGQVVGRPQILRMRVSGSGSTAVYRWFAAVGSGVNNYVKDPLTGLFSSSGKPALFLLALDKPAGTAWTLNSNYYKISLPVDSTLQATNATGLVNFAPVFAPTGEVAQIYAGDLHGNLWKLDFSTRDATDWNINKLSPFDRGTAGLPQPYPLYSARDASGGIQPITMSPIAIAGETRDSTYIAFATGKYLEVSDRTSTGTNSLYVIFDNGTSGADGNHVGPAAISGRGRLQAGVVDTSAKTITTAPFRWGRPSSNSDTSQRAGWYVDFAASGERQVSDFEQRGNILLASSLIPATSGGANSCSPAGGSSNEYALNVDNGNGTFVASNVGIMGKMIVIDTGTSSEETDSTGKRIRTVTSQVIQQGSTGQSVTSTIAITSFAGRLSWRQINNYRRQP